MRTRLCVVMAGMALMAFGPPALAEDGVIFLKAGRVDVGDGTSIANGIVMVRDGRIAAIGADLEIEDGACVIERADGVITPGLIDANAVVVSTKWDVDAPAKLAAHAHDGASDLHERHAHWKFPFLGLPTRDGCCGSTCPMVHMHVTGEKCRCCGFPDAAPEPTTLAPGTTGSVAEQSDEVVPFTRVIDTVDLNARDFARLASEGVTTVFISPDSASVIGARGAIVKTAGAHERRVVEPASAVKAAMGSDPSYRGHPNDLPYYSNVDFHSRRPHTRMGVTWVFRKAFYEALAAARGQGPIGGADTPPAAAIEPLQKMLERTIPLRIQARTQIDILSALRLTAEFGIDFILEEGIEAYRCVDELKARDVPVVYGPIFVEPVGWRALLGEADKAKLVTAKKLTDAGILTALTANDMRGEEGLAAQAMYAMRFGLSREQALQAVTSIPARILGIEDRVGTVAAGKDGDLILWSGEPFSSTSRPEVVLVGGEVAYEAK